MRARKAQFSDSLKGIQVIYLPVTGLIPSERNARTHSQEQIKQIAASIVSRLTNPILIDEHCAIIARHLR